jgi:predicted  nucleic acid-binding Zn-ribbon protein
MRNFVIVFAVALALGCGGCGNSSDAAKASGQARAFDTQRDALEKAKTVNNTVLQADRARRAQEEKQEESQSR